MNSLGACFQSLFRCVSSCRGNHVQLGWLRGHASCLWLPLSLCLQHEGRTASHGCTASRLSQCRAASRCDRYPSSVWSTSRFLYVGLGRQPTCTTKFSKHKGCPPNTAKPAGFGSCVLPRLTLRNQFPIHFAFDFLSLAHACPRLRSRNAIPRLASRRNRIPSLC